jgi:RNA polymerase sigma-70 factor (ECF subfamily)
MSCKFSPFPKDYLDVEMEAEFSRLLAAHGPALRRLAAAYMQDPSDQQDLFQEIAVALWTALPRFRAQASERTWLYRIAHNVALTWRARRHRETRSEEPLEEAALASPVPGDDHRRFVLLESVQRLGPVDRQLALLYLEGLSAREMEEVTGLAANAVGVRLNRLRHKLAAAVSGKEVRDERA